jgi:MFS superfamily sulfate permease-like transporter
MPLNLSFQEKLKKDFPSGLVVFLVALPLCLGIALASGAPVFSGIVAGVVGGIVVGAISGSHISVSGPAAGLTIIVLDALKKLGSFETFLLAVVLAGIFQLILGVLKAGKLAHFFPSSVINGMLASIGIILILKQIPHALGYDFDYLGDENFDEAGGHNTLTDIYYAIIEFEWPALLISGISLGALILWNKYSSIHKAFSLIPAALIAILLGVFTNLLLSNFAPEWALQANHLVGIPTKVDFNSIFAFPAFSTINANVLFVAFTIAIVASLETLLSVEASDRLDPFKRNTPLNRELFAQGVGNIFSGFLGGLPVTAVIVRSSANVVGGAVSKLSTIIHGILLFVCVVFLPHVLNLIPLPSLAAILFVVGYKLTSIQLFKSMFSKGRNHYIPFVITILAILFTDLLKGISIGLFVGLFFVAISNFKRSIQVTQDNEAFLIKLRYNVSFLNKSILRDIFNKIPPNSYVIIDGTGASFIDNDIMETIDNFTKNAALRKINTELKKSKISLNEYFRIENE